MAGLKSMSQQTKIQLNAQPGQEVKANWKHLRGAPHSLLPRPNTPQQPHTLMFPLQISSSIACVRVHLCVHICLGVRARAGAWSRQENYLTDLIGSLLRGLVTKHPNTEVNSFVKRRIAWSSRHQSRCFLLCTFDCVSLFTSRQH